MPTGIVFCSMRKPRPHSHQRRAAVGWLLALTGTRLFANEQSEAAAWMALGQGAIVLFRHTNAPGVGDPPGFKLQDCSTQRNLDATGRAQARSIGARFKKHGIKVGTVLTSQWCRCKETAELAFAVKLREEPAFNSFFSERSGEPAQTANARALLLAWKGPGALVVVTHQVNISALTGITLAAGEGIVLQPGTLKLIGQIAP
jgi:phosphohistidine phosphatase SixA